MQSSVPQYIDVEDKIVGPFTWKHLGWLLAMCAVLLVMYAVFDFQLFMIAGVPTALVFLSFAFYRPSGISMVKFVYHGIFFLFRPKVSVWERPVHVSNAPTVVAKRSGLATVKSVHESHEITEETLKSLAAVLDRQKRK
ncbi:MAG: PrgI family protein [Candidatus Moranbacteria bacterium]|nr:PrgI family protein [Candidatus Moranbacteria bacterium]